MTRPERLELLLAERRLSEEQFDDSELVGFVEELPGANSQGATLEEARRNLREAVELVLQANRTLAEADLGGSEVIREPLKLST